MMVRSVRHCVLQALVCSAILVGTAGCSLDAIEGSEANFITVTGSAPDGSPLGFAGNTIPMVDSTVVIRVLVADTIGTRAGQGLPASGGSAMVAWSVTSGSLEAASTPVGELGVAEARWTLGSDATQQSITATLQADGVTNTAVTISFSGQQSSGGLFPGPPVEFDVAPSPLSLIEGSSATIEISGIRDKYGNEWDPDLFDITLESSDESVVQNTVASSQVGVQVTVRGTGAGSATLNYAATGKLTTSYDFRGFTASASVGVSVEAFDGFAASFAMLSAGGGFACAVAEDGTAATSGAVYCWGANVTGSLGLPLYSSATLSKPRPELNVEGLPVGATVRALASGGGHTCASLDDGSVYCWGANDSRQLGSFGNDPGANRALLDNPNAASANETGFSDLVAGASHTCALGDSGNVYCWGANALGQLGSGATGQSQILSRRVAGLENVDVIALGDLGPNANHTCALASNGAVYCWGAGALGQLGDGGTANQPLATAVSGGVLFQSVSTAGGVGSGAGYTCGVSQTGGLYCWGDRPAGGGAVATPTSLSDGGGAPFVSIATAIDHACLVNNGGSLYCFGSASDGRLGNGVNSGSEQFSDPQAVSGGGTYQAVVLGADAAYGLAALGGSAVAWGNNADGQLAIAADAQVSATPAAVVFSTDPN